MAAQKEQRKAVVGLLGRLGGLHRFLADSRGHLPVTAGLVAAEQVDHSPVANPDQPAARVLRHPFGRPPLHRGEQRLLDGILGDLEVTESADQRAKHLRRFTAQQVLDANFVRGHRSVRFRGDRWRRPRRSPRP